MRRPFHSLTTAALIGALAGLAFATGCQAQPKDTQAADWDTFVQDFVEAYYAAHPEFAVQAGRHEFDGRLPDWRPAALKEEAARLRAERRRAAGFRAASLDGDQRFERDYLLSVIDRDLFWLESAQWPHRNPMFYAEALDPNVYLTRAYAPRAQRLRAYSAYARAIPAAAKQIRTNLRAPLPRTYIDVGQIVFGGLATYYEKNVPGVFGSVDDAQLQAEFRAANKRAIQAMKDLVRWLEEQRGQATEHFALGSVLFRRMLRETEGIDVPLEDLERVGREDVHRNLVALRDACTHYARGKPIEACITKTRAAKPKGGALAGAGGQLPELKTFLIVKDLVTIPGAEEARVAASPPYKRWNLAYIDIPGPHEQGLPPIYYVAPPDPMWSKAERETYVPATADLLFISVHEVWPGHFLQSQHARRSPSPFRQLFSSYAFTEGWAHYAEEMMWEAGLGDGDPETHIGQLHNALRRNARFLSALGLHTQGMTVPESERMFRELAYQDPGNARQQAARGTFDPGYLNYTLGKLMIRKLREEWVASRGGRQSWRAFHDQFLSYGGPPIPLIRKAMLGSNAGPPL